MFSTTLSYKIITIRNAWNWIFNSAKNWQTWSYHLNDTTSYHQAIIEDEILTMRTIFDITVLEPVEEASILKGPSWNRNLFGLRNRSTSLFVSKGRWTEITRVTHMWIQRDNKKLKTDPIYSSCWNCEAFLLKYRKWFPCKHGFIYNTSPWNNLSLTVHLFS